MKLYNRIKNLFYRPPAEYEEAYKSAINRVKQSQQTPETDPLIASCGKTVVDITVTDREMNADYSYSTVSKIYFNDGTVLVIESNIRKGYRDEPIIETKSKVNKYSIGKGKYTKSVYIEVEA